MYYICTANKRSEASASPSRTVPQAPAAAQVSPRNLIPKFALYDNVIAKWTDNKWYSGQIYRVLGEERYSVYFMDDNEVLDLTADELKRPAKTMVWAKLTRPQ